MMMRLKPCPFCGGDAKEFTGEDAAPHRWTVECDSCGAHVGSDTRHKARAKWNSRAERTCRNELDGQYDEATFKCSECGYECEVSVPFAPAPYSGDTDWDCELPKHCPGCGAMVVGGNDG